MAPTRSPLTLSSLKEHKGLKVTACSDTGDDHDESKETVTQDSNSATEGSSEPKILNVSKTTRAIATSLNELNNFFAQPNKSWPEQISSGKAKIARALTEGFSRYKHARSILKEIDKSDPKTYWEFRNYQIQQTIANIDNDLGILKRLGIETVNSAEKLSDPASTQVNSAEFKRSDFIKLFSITLMTGETQEKLIQRINKKIDDLGLPIKKFTELKDLISYFEHIRGMYQNITIAPNDEGLTDESFYIKNNTKNLVKISYISEAEHNNDSVKKVQFDIQPNLTKAELDQAILTMLDQSTRYQMVANNNQIEVYGFENNPYRALQIIKISIKNGCVPTIEDQTIKAWEEKLKTLNDPEKQKFKEAVSECIQLSKECQEGDRKSRKELIEQIKQGPSEIIDYSKKSTSTTSDLNDPNKSTPQTDQEKATPTTPTTPTEPESANPKSSQTSAKPKA